MKQIVHINRKRGVVEKIIELVAWFITGNGSNKIRS